MGEVEKNTDGFLKEEKQKRISRFFFAVLEIYLGLD